jgi:hypothetical protein
VRPTNYYARTFAGRLAASGLEQTPEASNSAPGFLPALTHFTGAVDAFPKEIINHFSMFKEVEAKLHDPEQMLKELFDEIAQLPITTKAQLRDGEQNTGGPDSSGGVRFKPYLGIDTTIDILQLLPHGFDSLTPEEQAIKKRQLFFRLRVLMAQIIPTLDEKLVVLQATKVTKDKGLMRMHHSYSQLDSEISDEARYGSLTHWAYADKEEKKKGGTTTHERQRREVASANNLAAAAQHVHDVDSIAAKSEARREAMLANKRSRHHQVDSDFDDRPVKKPQKRKPLAADTAPSDSRNLGLGISSNGTGPHGKRKKTEKALAAAATISAPAMERSLSGALKAAGTGGGRSGSSPRNTPGLENATASKRKPRAAPIPAQRKNQLPPYSPPLASSPLAANFAINKALAGASERPLSARARKNSIANSVASVNAQEASNGRRPSSSHSVQQITNNNAMAELDQAAGNVRDNTSIHGLATPRDMVDANPPLEPPAMKQEEHVQEEPESMDIDVPIPVALTSRAGRTSKTATPVVGAFPEIPMARSRSTRNANNSNSNASSENNSTTTGFVSKRGNKKNAQTASNAVLASPAVKPVPIAKSNPPSSAASSIAPDQENEYPEAEVESDDEGDEPRYCYCNEVSYGNMVACDNDDCPREWFHLACVNLEKAPVGRTKWFCSDECKEMHAKAKAKGGRPGSSRQ